MKGKVLGYDPTDKTGVIICKDGNRYKFSRDDWKNPSEPAINMQTDFVVDDQGRAIEIYRVGASSSDSGANYEKSKIVAGILAILLGGLGAHKFYLGRIGAGVLMLILSIFGWLFIWLVIPSFIWIISIIEGVIYLTRSDEQFQEIYVDGNKAWF